MSQQAREHAEPAEPAGLAAWRQLVETALKGRGISVLQSRTRDGILLDPLYPPARGAAPLPGRGGSPWLVIQVVDDPDPDLGNVLALEDLRGGATGLALRFAAGVEGSGLPPTRTALSTVLEGIDLGVLHMRIEPAPAGAELASWLREIVARQGIAPERASLSFGLDVLSSGLGQDDAELSQRVAGFADLRRAGFAGPMVELDGRPVHEAGGSEAQELACVLAAAAWWLRALTGAGVDAAAALPLFGASLSVDRDLLLSMAKIRALRRLWARFSETCAAPPSRLRIHAETSRRMVTRADPHTNILRLTIAAFAAAAGGADSIAVLPFTAALGPADGAARRLARNTQNLLLEESQLHRVADPAAGSGAVEALTAALAESAWREFQALEREGGLLESLRAGAFQQRIDTSRAALRTELARAAPLVGATIYRPAAAAAPPSAVAASAPGWLPPTTLEDLAESTP